MQLNSHSKKNSHF